MKSLPPQNSPQNERWDESDPLFRLLGESPKPEPGAWFATSTVARCRHDGRIDEKDWLPHNVTVQIWRWVFGAAVAISGIVALVTHIITLDNAQASSQKNVQDAFEIMAASVNTDPDSSATWQDTSE